MKMRAALPKLLTLVLLGAALVGVVSYMEVIQQYLDEFLDWAREVGLAGRALFVGVYVLATVLFFPGLILTLAAGYTFGLIEGVIVVSLGSTAGAAAAFLLGRTLVRDSIERKVAHSAKFAAVDRAVGRHGAKIVFLTRLSPVFPYNLLNYAFGLTSVRFWPYVAASWIGMLPATLMYVYLGSAVQNLADILAGKVQQDLPQQILFGVGLVATVLVTVLVTRIARISLQHDLPGREGAPIKAGM
jgi:uncharacterized membrane protein YdjX (TVP38/TMEM64 family)